MKLAARLALAGLLITSTLAATEVREPPPFSPLKAEGALPEAWQPLTVPKVKPNVFSLVTDQGVTVLRAEADAAAGTLAVKTRAAPGRLTWRWKIDRVVDGADITSKAGDDYAARLYVFFDVPVSALPFGARMRIAMAKTLYGAELPTAALCYVWDNRAAPGTSQWSSYTDRVRMQVLQSGGAKAGQWVAESRDLAQDFQAAFGFPAPAVTGIALGNDTDQTGERVTAWFGDVAFVPLATSKPDAAKP